MAGRPRCTDLSGLRRSRLSLCTATTYILQKNKLKQGSLNQYLPALDTASKATFILPVQVSFVLRWV